MLWHHQTRNNLPVLEVRLHNLIDVAGVDIGVPNTLRINHRHRPRRTAVQTTCLVDTNLPRPSQPGCFNLGFAAIKRSLCIILSTTRFTTLALVQTKKYVALKISWRRSAAVNGRFDLIHLGILVFYIPAPENTHDINHSRIRPKPAQPLSEPMKSDEPPLLPQKQSLFKIGADRSLIDHTQIHTQGQQSKCRSRSGWHPNQAQQDQQCKQQCTASRRHQPIPGMLRAKTQTGTQGSRRYTQQP